MLTPMCTHVFSLMFIPIFASMITFMFKPMFTTMCVGYEICLGVEL